MTVSPTGSAISTGDSNSVVKAKPEAVKVVKSASKGSTTSKVRFTNLFKDPEIIKVLISWHPLMWLKLKLTTRLFSWRLEDQAFAEMLPYLNEELGLTNAAVHELCAKGDVDSMWLMMLQGLAVTQRCPYSNATLLQKAIHSSSMPLISMLLVRGANPNVKGAYGYTALHECCYVGSSVMCQVLLNYKANPDAISKNGSTPLLVAAREGHSDIVDVLLRNNADPCDGGDKGWSPLFIAAGEGHQQVCQLLVQYGANVDEVSQQENKTPAEEAWANKHEALAIWLEQRMENPPSISGAPMTGGQVLDAETFNQLQRRQALFSAEEAKLLNERDMLKNEYMVNPSEVTHSLLLRNEEQINALVEQASQLSQVVHQAHAADVARQNQITGQMPPPQQLVATTQQHQLTQQQQLAQTVYDAQLNQQMTQMSQLAGTQQQLAANHLAQATQLAATQMGQTMNVGQIEQQPIFPTVTALTPEQAKQLVRTGQQLQQKILVAQQTGQQIVSHADIDQYQQIQQLCLQHGIDLTQIGMAMEDPAQADLNSLVSMTSSMFMPPEDQKTAM